MTKLSHTSYKQPHKPVSYGDRKAYNFFVKTQNRRVKNLYLNQLYARKLSGFLFLAVFFLLQFPVNVSIFLSLFCETALVC